jgi:hypothetical protein
MIVDGIRASVLRRILIQLNEAEKDAQALGMNELANLIGYAYQNAAVNLIAAEIDERTALKQASWGKDNG